MKNKKNRLLEKIILILIISIFFLTNISFAAKGWDYGFKASDSGIENEVTKVEALGNGIIGIIQIVGVAVGVIMLIILGVKYMTSASSEKADIKKKSIIYIVGAILVFSSTGILQLIKNYTDTSLKEETEKIKYYTPNEKNTGDVTTVAISESNSSSFVGNTL